MPVEKPIPAVAAALPQWTRCRDAYDGQDCVKAKTTDYLPLLGSHSNAGSKEYQAYLSRAQFYNGTGRTVEALAGTVFRKDAEIAVPDTMKPMLEDITLTGLSLNAFAMALLEELIKISRGGLLVDWSDLYSRPYLVAYKGEQIINWRAPVINGKRTLSLLVLKETVEEPDPEDDFTPIQVDQYRVYRRLEQTDGTGMVTVQLYRRSQLETDKKGEFIAGPANPLLRKGVTLDFIPFVILPDIDIEKPALIDLVDVNFSLYRTSADLEHGRHFTGLPQPWVVGAPQDVGSLTIGSSEAWLLENSPNSKCGYMEFNGEGLGSLEKAEESKKKMMAVLGARLLEEQPSVQDTATAVRERQSGEMSVIKRLALRASSGLTRAIQWAGWWMGATSIVDDEKIKIHLNTDFVAQPLDPQQLAALVAARQGGEISRELFWHALVKGEHIPPGWTKEDEQKLLDAELKERSERMIKESLAISGAPNGDDEEEDDDEDTDDNAGNEDDKKAAA